jgi:hypothetical protein
MEQTKDMELQLLQEENSKKLSRCSIATLRFEKAISEWEIDIDSYNQEQQIENEIEEQKFDESHCTPFLQF